MALTYTEEQYNAVLTSTAAQLQASGQALAAAVAKRDEVIAVHEKFLVAAQNAYQAGDEATMKAILFPAIEEAAQSEQERKNAALQAKVDELRAQADKLAAEIVTK